MTKVSYYFFRILFFSCDLKLVDKNLVQLLTWRRTFHHIPLIQELTPFINNDDTNIPILNNRH